jgi:hypothetical protein
LIEARRLLLISGNAATQQMVETALIGGHKFQLMAKPVLPHQLLAVVADMPKDTLLLSTNFFVLVNGIR